LKHQRACRQLAAPLCDPIIKPRRKIASWDPNYLATLLNSPPR